MSVFYYEILDDKKSAKQIALESIVMAEDKLDTTDEATYKEAKSILALLKENYEKWVLQPDDDEDEDVI